MSKTEFGDFPYLTYRNISLSTTGQVIKASSGCIYEYYFYNSGGAIVYIKLYNKATAATSSDTPVRTYAVGAGQGANCAIDLGIQFLTGIGIRASTGVADNDNTAPGANEVTVNIGFR